MHVFFKGDELKVCRFFSKPKQSVSNISESDEEECMYVGKWTTKIETGRRIPAMFYTTDFDDREEIGESSFTTVRTGQDLGYTSCVYGDDPADLRTGRMLRRKTFRRVFKTHAKSGIGRDAAIAVPEGIREGYYYAKLDYSAGDIKSESVEYVTLTDPYIYITWRNFYDTGRPHPAGCGPVSRRTVWYQVYDESACSDFANSGEWASPCDDAESMRYNINLPQLSPIATIINPFHRRLEVSLVCCAERAPLRSLSVESDNQYFDGGFWFIPSPDPDTGLTAFIHATHNALGDGDSLKYNQNINDTESVVVGAPNYPQMATKPITFIGVINGV
jgi:hypothetical protein